MRTQVSTEGTESFIMETILLASLLSCSEGAFILGGLNTARIEDSTRSEIRIEILQSMPDTCTPEEYSP